MRILVVEDDPSLGASVKKGLERHQYAVDLVMDGQEAMAMARLVPYDLIVLDVLLPNVDGFEVCKRLRRQMMHMPVLFLTALEDVLDRVNGLDLGADDYLTKPFAFVELEARVRALLRRDGPSKTPTLRFLDITLNTLTHEVRRGERIIPLAPKEYALLEFLMRHPRQVLSRSMLVDHLWNVEVENLSNVIDVYVRYVRNKLCEQGEPDVIQTIRGAGYQLKEPPDV
jgi:DNA-binding response OmpR family regulator